MQRPLEDDLVGHGLAQEPWGAAALSGDRRRGRGASQHDNLGIGVPFAAVRAKPCTPSAAARKPRLHPSHARRIHLSPAVSRNELRGDPSLLPGLRISETRETTEGSAELEFRIQFPPAVSLQTFGSWPASSASNGGGSLRRPLPSGCGEVSSGTGLSKSSHATFAGSRALARSVGRSPRPARLWYSVSITGTGLRAHH